MRMQRWAPLRWLIREWITLLIWGVAGNLADLQVIKAEECGPGSERSSPAPRQLLGWLLTRYHCLVKRGSLMLTSISLIFLYPRFWRLKPSWSKTFFTCGVGGEKPKKYPVMVGLKLAEIPRDFVFFDKNQNKVQVHSKCLGGGVGWTQLCSALPRRRHGGIL